jgi:phage terminase small subunit
MRGIAIKFPILLGAVQSVPPMVCLLAKYLLILAKGGESMLTPKQEAFVQNIIQGMSQADAYRSAYSSKNMSDNAVYREASLLMDNPKVAQRLKELRDKLAKPSIMSAQERLEWLTQLIKSKAESTTDKLRAADIMNKMQGEYVQKVEADLKSAVNINIELSDD